MNIEGFAGIIGVPVQELLGRSQVGRLPGLRQLLWLRLREEGYTTTETGKLFGRSHSAVVLGIKRIKNLIETGDPFVKEWNEKIKTMSKEKHIIEIHPPAYYSKNREIEMHSIRGFACPRCGGRGHFMPQEIEKDKYKEVECRACLGTGKLRADVIIQWIAEKDHGGE